MKKNILIASAKGPVDEEGFKNICADIRTYAGEMGITIPGILWTEGPGCSNLALACVGEEEIIEHFGNGITMAFMPSKWCGTKDEVPDGDLCLLSFTGQDA